MPTVCREPVPAWKVIPCVGARVMQSTTMEPNLIDFDKAFVVVNPAALLKGMAGAYGSMAMKRPPHTPNPTRKPARTRRFSVEFWTPTF